MKHVLGGSLVLPLCFSLSCATSGGGTAPDANSSSNGGAGTGSSGNKGGGAAFNPDGTGGVPVSDTNNGTAPPDKDASCASSFADAKLTQVNILVLLDKSGSMGIQISDVAGSWDNCDDRWNPVIDTLNNFFKDSNSSRLYASLSFLPSDGDNTAICNPNSYSGSAGLKVPLTLLDDTGRAKFQAKLCECHADTSAASTCIKPEGGTPTRPALQGTINYAAKVDQQNPGSKTVIVLITDGEPRFACQDSAGNTRICNSCDDLTNGCLTDPSNCLDAGTEIDKISAVIQSAPEKSIRVVGVGTDLQDSTFDAWASASGNEGIDLRSKVGAEAAATLRAELESIRKSSISCEFDVPPNAGGNIDVSKTFVYYTAGSGDGVYIDHSTDWTKATCSTSLKNWYFDDPKLPKKITLCGHACDTLQQDSKGRIEIEYGCQSRTIIY